MKASIIAALSIGLPLSAHTQTDRPPPRPSQIYTVDDFAQYAPRTALDMVGQIPGFSLSRGDNSRGFGQAQENVLINGQRISSKSSSARDALNRIPVDNVVSIEIIDGASLDIPGLNGQVVNVTTNSTGLSGTWSLHHRIRENLPPANEWFELSLSGTQGDIEWTFGLEAEPGRGASAGRENIFDGDGNLTEYREEEFTYIAEYPTIRGGLTWTPESGSIANLNLQYSLYADERREASNAFLPDGTEIASTVFQAAEDEWNSEISADYDFSIGPGRLKFIGLQRNEHSPTFSRFFGGNLTDAGPSETVFEQTVDESESILRTEYNLQTSPTTDWQFSLEGAFNSLESEASLAESIEGAPSQPIDIGAPLVKVEETRSEAFITHGRELSPNLQVQVSLGAEISEISSDGTNGQSRAFTRPKGSISATWTKSDNLTITANLEREVGQLNFFDFVFAADVNQGDDQAGNLDIVPEQIWRAELAFERDFGNWGATTLTLFGENIEDIIDQIPIGTGEGPGNLESARRFGYDLEGTLKLDKTGFRGAQITYESKYRLTEVDDPLTGETRRIGGSMVHYHSAEFRHDIPNTDWAWGLSANHYAEAPVYRLDSRRKFSNSPAFAWGFIEHKDIFGMTGTAFFGNLLNQDDNLERVIYTPDRTGTIDRIEDRNRNFGNVFTLRLKGTF